MVGRRLACVKKKADTKSPLSSKKNSAFLPTTAKKHYFFKFTYF